MWSLQGNDGQYPCRLLGQHVTIQSSKLSIYCLRHTTKETLSKVTNLVEKQSHLEETVTNLVVKVTNLEEIKAKRGQQFADFASNQSEILQRLTSLDESFRLILENFAKPK